MARLVASTRPKSMIAYRGLCASSHGFLFARSLAPIHIFTAEVPDKRASPRLRLSMSCYLCWRILSRLAVSRKAVCVEHLGSCFYTGVGKCWRVVYFDDNISTKRRGTGRSAIIYNALSAAFTWQMQFHIGHCSLLVWTVSGKWC